MVVLGGGAADGQKALSQTAPETLQGAGGVLLP